MNHIIRKVIVVSAILFASELLTAQRVLISEDVAHERAIRNTQFGPNKKHYTHFTIFAGQILGASSDSLPAQYFGSGSFGFGFRYKNKITKWWAHGIDLAYNYQSFRIKQNDEKSFRTSEKYKKEAVNQHQLQSAYFWRFRIGQAGNYVGNYIDVGGFGSWTFANNHKWVQQKDTPNVKRIVTNNRQVNYLESIEYGVIGRVGFNKFSIYGKYRLSEIVKSQSSVQPKLPAIVVGMEIKI